MVLTLGAQRRPDAAALYDSLTSCGGRGGPSPLLCSHVNDCACVVCPGRESHQDVRTLLDQTIYCSNRSRSPSPVFKSCIRVAVVYQFNIVGKQLVLYFLYVCI